MIYGRKTIAVLKAAWLIVLLCVWPAAARSAFDVYLADAGQQPGYYHAQPAVRKHTSGRHYAKLAGASVRQAARTIAAEYGIPPRLYEALCEFESGFIFARGSSGEHGYSQVMEKSGQMLQDNGQVRSTWRHDPLENLRAGAVHLSNLKAALTIEEIRYAKRHGYNLWAILLAQYNAGKTGVARRIRAGGRLSGKQEWYIYNVLKRYNRLER